MFLQYSPIHRELSSSATGSRTSAIISEHRRWAFHSTETLVSKERRHRGFFRGLSRKGTKTCRQAKSVTLMAYVSKG